MTMSTCPVSTILGPGVQLGVPRICLRHIFAREVAAVQVSHSRAQKCTTASASSHSEPGQTKAEKEKKT